MDLLEESSDPAVTKAAMELAAKSPNLSVAQISQKSVEILATAVRDSSLRPNAFKILAAAGYKDPVLRLQAAEALISMKLLFEAQGKDLDSREVGDFLSQTPDFRNVLRDAFNETYDYKVRLEALRLAGLAFMKTAPAAMVAAARTRRALWTSYLSAIVLALLPLVGVRGADSSAAAGFGWGAPLLIGWIGLRIVRAVHAAPLSRQILAAA